MFSKILYDKSRIPDRGKFVFKKNSKKISVFFDECKTYIRTDRVGSCVQEGSLVI